MVNKASCKPTIYNHCFKTRKSQFQKYATYVTTQT